MSSNNWFKKPVFTEFVKEHNCDWLIEKDEHKEKNWSFELSCTRPFRDFFVGYANFFRMVKVSWKVWKDGEEHELSPLCYFNTNGEMMESKEFVQRFLSSHHFMHNIRFVDFSEEGDTLHVDIIDLRDDSVYKYSIALAGYE